MPAIVSCSDTAFTMQIEVPHGPSMLEAEKRIQERLYEAGTLATTGQRPARVLYNIIIFLTIIINFSICTKARCCYNSAAAIQFRENAVSFVQNHQLSEAISLLKLSIAHDPNFALAYHDLGSTYMRLDDDIPALVYLSYATYLDDTLSISYFNRGLCFLKYDTDVSIDDFSKSIDVDKTLSVDLTDLFWNYVQSNRVHFRKNKKYLDLIIKICRISNWEDPFIIYILADYYSCNNKFDKAIELQKFAITLLDANDSTVIFLFEHKLQKYKLEEVHQKIRDLEK